MQLSHGICHYRVDGVENPGRLVVLVHGMLGSEDYFRCVRRVSVGACVRACVCVRVCARVCACVCVCVEGVAADDDDVPVS